MSAAQTIRTAMALAFFANAYADQAEEAGQPLCGEIMDQLPADIDPAALAAADRLVKELLTQFDFAEKGRTENVYLLSVYMKASNIWAESSQDGDRDCTMELFGHYCAMQAMGTGVGLESFGSAVYDAIPVPYLEFGGYSLEKDYF